MDGYRCVKYIDLCRICSSADDKKVNIFADEGSKLNLQKKIEECLPVTLSEKDKLPKFICSTCLEYVEFIIEFRKTSLNAQEMLKSCLNSSKLTNGGQVYIKNEPNSPKKFLKAIKQNKLQNKVSIITSPILNSQAKNYIVQTPIKKTTSQGAVGSDFLSSIIRAAGIQTTDDTSESQGLSLGSPTQMSSNNNPQYTVTLDGSPSKTGHYQYKIENINTLQTKSMENIQQNVEVSQVTKSSSKTQQQQQQKQKKDTEDPKSKKPKINFIVQTTPSKEPKVSQSQQILNSLQTPQPKTFGTASTLNTPVKTTPNKSGIQIQDIKILPKGLITTPLQTPNKQFVVPIMLKNDNASGGNELMSSTLNTSNNSGQITYVQMKLQQNTDGQGYHLTPATMPLLSPQAIQQLSFASPQHIQQTQMTPQIQSVHSLQQVSQANQTEMKTTTEFIEEMDQDDNIDFSTCDMQDTDQDTDLQEHETFKSEPTESSAIVVHNQIPKTTATTSMPSISSTSTPKKPTTLTVVGVNPTVFTPVTFSMSSKKENSTPLQAEHILSTNDESPNKSQDHCEMANNQLAQLSSHSIKHQISNSSNKSAEINLTTCDVCKKVFKKKEHLMQHLKSHIGLRPFKCKDEGCNKTFSRKEHLLRHELSHTGTKMFSCDLCHKLFSRKDNLNKHRRIHPEANGGEKSYTCPVCEKTYTTKNQLTRCKESHELDTKVENGKQKKFVPKAKSSSKKVKTKEDKSEEPVLRVIAPNQQQQQQQQQQPQIVTIVQQQPQQQLKVNKDGQVMQLQLAMPIMSQNYQTIGGQKTQTMQLQPDQAKQIIKTLNAVTTGGENSNVISGNTLFTMPSSFVINPTTFVTASGELVNSFKIENQ